MQVLYCYSQGIEQKFRKNSGSEIQVFLIKGVNAVFLSWNIYFEFLQWNVYHLIISEVFVFL